MSGNRHRVRRERLAAVLAAIGFVALAVFQLALALGAPLGHAAWGGDSAELATGQRVGSGLSVVAYAAAAAIVLARVGLTARPRSPWLLEWCPWALAVVFALSALANFASQSSWERYLLGPSAVILAGLCLIVARTPATPRG